MFDQIMVVFLNPEDIDKMFVHIYKCCMLPNMRYYEEHHYYF